MRIVCANTQTAAIDRAKATFGIRHTGGARAAIQDARTALGLTWRYMHAFEAEAAATLFAAPMELDQMRDFAAELVEVDKADSRTAARNRSERAAGIVKLWTSLARRSRPSPGHGGRPTTRSLSTSTTTPRCAPHSDQAAARALRAVTIGSTAQALKTRAFRMLQTV